MIPLKYIHSISNIMYTLISPIIDTNPSLILKTNRPHFEFNGLIMT
jgi:hypothetical protein